MSDINPIVKKLRESRRLREEQINYAELDHDILIQLAQQEDQQAFEELVSQYSPLIDKQSRKFFIGGGTGDEEDIKQIATMAFWDAVTSYNPGVHKGGFGAYASMIMNRKLTDVLRKEDADVRKLNNLAGSTEDTIGGDDEGGETTVGDTLSDKVSAEDRYLGDEGARDIMKFIETNLSDNEREAIKLKIAGYSVSEIAEELDMKYKTVENALMRVKNKLAERMRSSQQESKKLKESEIEFSEEEKQILNSVFNKISESKSLRESALGELAASYEKMSAYEIQDELEDIEADIDRIEGELKYTKYDERSSLVDDLEDLSDKLNALEDYLSDEQYEEAEKLRSRIHKAEDIDYVELTADDYGPDRREEDF